MHYIDAAFEIAGALTVILSTLGATLPEQWGFTRFCRVASADIRLLLSRRQ